MGMDQTTTIVGEEAPPASCIIERRVYVQHPSGLEVMEQRIVSGVAPSEFARFASMVGIKWVAPGGIPMQGQKIVAIPAETIEDAFELLPELVTAAVEEIRVQGNRQVLLMGTAPDPGEIAGRIGNNGHRRGA